MKRLFTLLSFMLAANISQAQTYCNPATTSPCVTGTVRIAGVKTTGGTTNINNNYTPTAVGTPDNSCGTVSPGYSYYTGSGMLLSAPAGSNSVKISVYSGQVGGSGYITWSYRVYIWVDWNQNKHFNNVPYNPASPATDTGELMLVNVNMSQTTPTVVLPFPPRAKHGLTRMRIRMNGTTPSTTFPPASPAADPCTATGTINGEVEDYDVFCDNPCVKIPSVSFSNTNQKGTDVIWTPKGNELWYEYKVDQNPADPGNGNTLLKPNITSMHLPDTFMKTLKCATKYYFHIRGICDTLDGGNQANWYYSPWRLDSFTTDPCCDVPEVTISNIEAHTALATWGPVTSVQNYEYQVRMDTIIGTKGTITSSTSLTLPGLQCSRMYYFYLRALCSPTPTSDWGVDSFLTQPCLSIDNGPVLPEFKINAYPNPVKDVVTLTVLHGIKHSDAEIVVTDIAGRTVLSTIMTADKINIDLREQAPGIYFVKYADEERTQVVKISKE